MKSHLRMLGIVLVAGTLAVIGGTACTMLSRVVTAKTHVATTQPVYVCLDCHVLSMRPGPCALCKKELVERHLSEKAGKCGCGRRLKKVDAAVAPL